MFKSKKHKEKMAHLLKLGKITQAKWDAWERVSPPDSQLPEYVTPKQKTVPAAFKLRKLRHG